MKSTTSAPTRTTIDASYSTDREGSARRGIRLEGGIKVRQPEAAGPASAGRQPCQACVKVALLLAVMRDFLAAIRDRVVVFDGGMGATLEQFDLSLEDDYRLPGRCHEALVLNRPDVIEGVHESMVEAGAEVVETDTFQASRLKLDEWGLGEHTLEINRSAAEIARKAVGEDRFVAGSIGPTGHLPASDDPTLGNIRFRELVARLHRAGPGPDRGRRRPDHHRDRAGHPRGQGRHLRRRARRSSSPAAAPPIQTSVSLLPNGGKMLLGTDISRRARPRSRRWRSTSSA